MLRSMTLILLVALLPSRGFAAELTIQEWLDVFIDSCVGSGSSFTAGGSINAGGGLSLQKLKADGTIAGQVNINHASFRLLSEGMSNSMSAVTADQANKVRDCLEPVRRTLLQAMNQQMAATNPLAKPVFILTPYEDAIMKALATTRGEGGETGKNVAKDVILKATGQSDIRFSATIKQLQSKVLAVESPFVKFVGAGVDAQPVQMNVVSLWDDGQEYVLNMGYAK